MMAILTKYWRPLAIIIIVAICALWVVNKVSSYGEQRYNDRYAKAVAEQKGRRRTRGATTQCRTTEDSGRHPAKD